MVVAIGLIMWQMLPQFRLMQDRIDKINRVLREQIAGIRVVRAFVREPQEHERFGVANDELTAAALRAGRLQSLIFPTVMLVFNVSSVAVLWFGASAIDAGTIQIGALTAFLAYLMQILMSVMMATFMLMMVPRAAVSADRIGEVLATDSTVVAPADGVTTASLRGHVELRGVAYNYPGAEVPVLCDVSLTAPAGRTTAIIGSTGSGKTTLLSLIPRLFDVVDGEVLVDGVDVRAWEPDALRQRIAIVPQKPYLFSGTVASNLRYGNPDATDDELWRFLEIAQARDFVAAMPEGLYAPIAQGGTNVSGGQRQRLAIARALVREPEIYLFDDAFSALDLGTDARLRAALRPVVADAAVIVVAQRVSTIVDADQIVVLEDGAVMGVGSHDELHRDVPDVRRDRRLAAVRRSSGMSAQPPKGNGPVPSRLPAAGGARRGGPPWMSVGQPTEKSMNFGPSARRIVGRLRQFWAQLAVIISLGVLSVTLAVIGPKVLGQATNIIFAGLPRPEAPAGGAAARRDRAAARARRRQPGEPARDGQPGAR